MRGFFKSLRARLFDTTVAFRKGPRYAIRRVSEIPDRLKDRPLYVMGKPKPWSVALLCPCGCKETIHISLLENDCPSWSLQIAFTKRSLETDDLLSLPDLAAGVLGDYLSKRDVVRPDEIGVKEGADNVLQWLGNAGIGLKKSCFFLQAGEGGAVQRGAIEFAAINPPSRTFVPIYVQAAIEPR
jgi:hypothetical protein